MTTLSFDPTPRVDGEDDNLGYQLSAGFLSADDVIHNQFSDFPPEVGRPLANGRAYRHYLASLENIATDLGVSAMLKHASDMVEKMMPRALSMQSRDVFFPMRFKTRSQFSTNPNSSLFDSSSPGPFAYRLLLTTEDSEAFSMYLDISF